MGHHHNTIVGTGKNRKEAQREAIDEFLEEEGHRHSVRDCSGGHCIKKVPPQHTVKKKEGSNTYITSEPNHDAPKDQWLEVWEFELHTHA
jgi:hypothetical protein